MCGITGYWAHSSPELAETTFAAFTHSLAHRGPDGFGIEHFPAVRLWLGHRRLAIVDLSPRGRQPMSHADGRYWLTYNGEVYNYLELREELRGLGHRFVTDSDSEVILAAYAQWGQECQLRFNGMWAFAIWDACEHRLFLSRDRFGIKPLHYCDRNGAFVFASELKAFLALPWVDGSFDAEILAETLTNIDGQESTPFTLLPGIRRLPPGHAMLVEANGHIQITAWWNTLDHLPQPGASLDEQSEEFRALFFDSCRLRLRSDVPLATALSGGLDSSAAACSLAELNRRGLIDHAPKDWQRAFVACFKSTPYDERHYAKMVVDHTGMIPDYLDIDDQQALKHIEKVFFDHEAIRGHSMVGAWTLYQAMRGAGIRVSIDGHGADELVGGYHSFVETAMHAAAGTSDVRRYLDLRNVLAGLVGGTEASGYANVASELRLIARGTLARLRLLEPVRAALASVRSLSGPPRQGLVEQPVRRYEGPHRLYYNDADPRVLGLSTLQSIMFTWFHGSFLPSILSAFDRSSMSHGIEVRMPFMDWRLVTYGFALPETSKIGGGYTKRILREAMRGILPEPIRLRTKKIGFVPPMQFWSRGALKPWLLDISASRDFLDSSVWNGRAARASVHRAVDGDGTIFEVWPVLNAYVLERSFKARAKALQKPMPTGGMEGAHCERRDGHLSTSLIHTHD
jgi:asparagine synthase (glutamine-hydrolysing)